MGWICGLEKETSSVPPPKLLAWGTWWYVSPRTNTGGKSSSFEPVWLKVHEGCAGEELHLPAYAGLDFGSENDRQDHRSDPICDKVPTHSIYPLKNKKFARSHESLQSTPWRHVCFSTSFSNPSFHLFCWRQAEKQCGSTKEHRGSKRKINPDC